MRLPAVEQIIGCHWLTEKYHSPFNSTGFEIIQKFPLPGIIESILFITLRIKKKTWLPGEAVHFKLSFIFLRRFSLFLTTGENQAILKRCRPEVQATGKAQTGPECSYL